MQLQMSGRNIEITPALRELTEKKLKKLEQHFTHITNIHIILEVNKIRQIAEAIVSIPKNTIHAQAESDDMYKTIDDLMEKLKSQLIKHKEKDSDHR